MTLLKDIPKRTPFVFMDFESDRLTVCEHYGLIHSHFDHDGESVYVYDVVVIGNLWSDGKIMMTARHDRPVSSRAGHIMNCKLVGTADFCSPTT
jgi:hypothetical protein